MSRLTRTLALLSAFAAVGVTAYAGSPAIPSLPLVCAVTAASAAGLASVSRRAALLLSLLPVYLSPAIFLIIKGHDAYAYVTVWIAALLGVIAGTAKATPWSVPPRWRWVIATWAVLIAVSWPLVAWRELDFTWPLVWDTRLPIATIRLSGPAAVGWTGYVALSHLVGLLWIDWLFQTFTYSTREPFRREVVAPLAASAAFACLVGLYQGFFDIGFLSGHLWPAARRAAGTLMDANAFGMLAALWAPAFLVLGLWGTRLGPAVAVVGFPLAWIGVWTSGSRTALLACLVGTILATIDISRYLHGKRVRRTWVAAIAGAALLLLLAIASVPSVSMTALERVGELVPSSSWSSVQDTVRRLWERDGFGTAAVAMFTDFPVFGVGVGSYHSLVRDYAWTFAGAPIGPDNAQNWFRHQLAELGLVGSIGWIGWMILFAPALLPRQTSVTGPGIALRGPLLGFALASLVGMPGQDPAIVITFWLFVFWYMSDTGVQRDTRQTTPWLGWVVMLVLIAGYSIATFARADLRPPFRAARFDFNHTYGFYFDPEMTWSAGHGVTVPRAPTGWMKLTYWVSHPDADREPVAVRVWRGQERIVDRHLRRDQRVVQYVQVPGGNKRFVLEVKVDRTWRPADYGQSDPRELGLGMRWEFVDQPPGETAPTLSSR